MIRVALVMTMPFFFRFQLPAGGALRKPREDAISKTKKRITQSPARTHGGLAQSRQET
jgi:hypothetical protein